MTSTGRADNRMRYYRIIREADGTFSVYITEVGTLPGRYSGFKSEADANRWAAEQQKHPDLPPLTDKTYPDI
jgi:hypothetical protein